MAGIKLVSMARLILFCTTIASMNFMFAGKGILQVEAAMTYPLVFLINTPISAFLGTQFKCTKSFKLSLTNPIKRLPLCYT